VYVTQREKATSALAASATVSLIAYVLIFGLQVAWKPHGSAALISVNLEPPRPPPTQQPKRPVKRAKAFAPKGAPSPPNLKNKATQVVAPPKQLPIRPPPIVTATQAGIGNAVSSGASDRPGPGQGAGGIGDGTGGGGEGGDGDGYGAEVGPRHIRGRLRFADVPEALLGPGQTATIGVRFTVETNGRVTNCRIDRSSRIAALDTLVCRLIERRFRFRPALDGYGRPMRATVVETHEWSVPPEEPDD
jgi:protein TonB